MIHRELAESVGNPDDVPAAVQLNPVVVLQIGSVSGDGKCIQFHWLSAGLANQLAGPNLRRKQRNG